MTKTIAAFKALCLVLALLAGPPATAAEGNLVIAANVAVAPPADEVKRAQALLDRAAAHYLANGKNALAAFGRIGDFVDGDLYVYAIGNDGTMIASGGPSITLVGRDVRDLKDTEGKPFFAEMIENAKQKGGGAVGAMPRLVGRDTGELRDVNGKPIIRQMIDIVNAKGAGELQYVWPNPVTRKQEKKTTYLQRVDGYLVAVGHYTR